MSGIGNRLKETRENKGLSLEQVQQNTKIHIEYLRALEQEQFNSLPSPFYVRAFLRTYAHSLELDAQPLLDRYERLSAAGRVQGRQSSSANHATQGRERVGGMRQRRPMQQSPRLGRTYSPRSQRMAPPSPYGRSASAFANENQQSRQQTNPLSQQGTSRFRTIPPRQAQPSVSPSTQRYQPPVTPPGETGTGSQQNLQQTLTPRKVSQEIKRGMAEGDGRPKKNGASKWMVRVAAIGALLLVSIGGYTVITTGSDDNQVAKNEQPQDGGASDKADTTDKAQADALDAPTLTKVETGEELEGDLYVLENADKLKVEIKASKGDTNINVGSKVNQVEDSYEISAGEQRTLSYDKFVWFRLTKPSNTQIKVNGDEIDTLAQDVPRSYRIQLKK